MQTHERSAVTRAGGADLNLQTLFRGMAVNAPDTDVADITTDSRNAVAGGLFLACGGVAHHGLDFLDQALAAGVRAVAWEPAHALRTPRIPHGVDSIPVPDLRFRVGELADRFFGAPSSELVVSGITGTNGKSTVAWLLAQALQKLGRSAGYMGTLGYGIGSDVVDSALTTPGCVTVHRRLRELRDKGAVEVAAEVSSHALDQGRVSGVRFDVVAFTNLTQDHLDYHGDLARYGAAKARLFTDYAARAAVINVGDDFGRRLRAALPSGTEAWPVQLVDGALTVRDGVSVVGRLEQVTGDGLEMRLATRAGEARLASRLWGRFNAENLLVAAGCLLARGVPLADAAAALATGTAPPGRMQLIRGSDRKPVVVVDFAHTPDALEKALAAVREHCRGQIWCVFGCGGDRDRGKRPAMGAIAVQRADRVVVTDDNPRTEDPQQIIADILMGAPMLDRLQVVPDRAAAIARAIRSAGPEDVVLVAGKGHETYQLIGTERRAFSDVATAREVLGETA